MLLSDSHLIHRA